MQQFDGALQEHGLALHIDSAFDPDKALPTPSKNGTRTRTPIGARSSAHVGDRNKYDKGKGSGKTRLATPTDHVHQGNPDESMDSDDPSIGDTWEPDSASAAKALRFVEHTFGHEHFVCIRALEKARAPEVPIHIAMGKVASRLDKLAKKLANQSSLMVQATQQHQQAEERMSELAANMAGTETDIRAMEAERDSLLANCKEATGSTGTKALNQFLEGADGLVDPAIITRLRDEMAAISSRVQAGAAQPGVSPQLHPLDPNTGKFEAPTSIPPHTRERCGHTHFEGGTRRRNPSHLPTLAPSKNRQPTGSSGPQGRHPSMGSGVKRLMATGSGAGSRQGCPRSRCG